MDKDIPEEMWRLKTKRASPTSFGVVKCLSLFSFLSFSLGERGSALRALHTNRRAHNNRRKPVTWVTPTGRSKGREEREMEREVFCIFCSSPDSRTKVKSDRFPSFLPYQFALCIVGSVLRSLISHVHARFNPQSSEVETRHSNKSFTVVQAQYQFPLAKCWESEGPQQKAKREGATEARSKRERERERRRERKRLTSEKMGGLSLSPSLPHTHTNTPTHQAGLLYHWLLVFSLMCQEELEKKNRESKEYLCSQSWMCVGVRVGVHAHVCVLR